MTTQHRLMYDSVDAFRIPTDAQMVAGYGNGEFKWQPEDWERFPQARKVRIDVTGADPQTCGVLDIERGAATITDAPDWIRARTDAGHRAVIYCSRSLVTAVTNGIGIRGQWALWVADWTGHPHELSVGIAVQYLNDKAAGYDLSAVYDSTWHG